MILHKLSFQCDTCGREDTSKDQFHHFKITNNRGLEYQISGFKSIMVQDLDRYTQICRGCMNTFKTDFNK